MSYVLGLRIQETFPDGMFINAEEPTRSLRSQPAEGGELVLAVGDGHPTGSGNPTHQHYKQLEDWVRAIYNVRSIDYHWLTEDVVSEDGVPFIGRLTPTANISIWLPDSESGA